MMSQITVDLIRKRAEHNDGLIHTLEEISLHQEEIEKINPVLGKNCKHLKILYLQNNIIGKMENLHYFKELKYLNLALNNIQIIDGLSSCEMLEKLDLTVNFIDLDCLEMSINHLAPLYNLRDLYMIGNPSQVKWKGFNKYVISKLPQLQRLDGTDITKSMRILADQQQAILEEELKILSLESVERKKTADSRKVSMLEENKRDEKLPHTPDVRTQMYREIAEQKREKEERQKSNLPRQRNYEEEQEAKISRVREIESGGTIRQCNEGKLSFNFDESSVAGVLKLNVEVPRFLNSSLIDVDVHPYYVSIVIKGKVLRLTLPVEVKSDVAKAQRSNTTGNLVIFMPKANKDEIVGLRNDEKKNGNKSGRTVANSHFSKPRVTKKNAAPSIADMMISAVGIEECLNTS